MNECYLVFFDDEKEAMQIMELKVENIDVKTPPLPTMKIKHNKRTIIKCIQKAEPYKIKIQMIIPAIRASGDSGIVFHSMERKIEILGESDRYGIEYGDYLETQREYLAREKKAITKFIRRKSETKNESN